MSVHGVSRCEMRLRSQGLKTKTKTACRVHFSYTSVYTDVLYGGNRLKRERLTDAVSHQNPISHLISPEMPCTRTFTRVHAKFTRVHACTFVYTSSNWVCMNLVRHGLSKAADVPSADRLVRSLVACMTQCRSSVVRSPLSLLF